MTSRALVTPRLYCRMSDVICCSWNRVRRKVVKSLGYWGLIDLCIRSMGIRQRG